MRRYLHFQDEECICPNLDLRDLSFRTYIARLAIRKALKRNAPDRIPRTGEAGRQADFFSVLLSFPVTPPLEVLLDEINDSSIAGRAWNSDRFESECVLRNELLERENVSFQRYYGLHDIEYRSAASLLFFELIRWPAIIALTERLTQFVFNLRTPVRSDRIQLLKALVDDCLTDAEMNHGFVRPQYRGASAARMIEVLYGRRMYSHPKFRRRHPEVQLMLESLIASGDAELVDGRYRATGKAFWTILDLEEDRRHSDTVAQNRRLAVFTFWLVIVGLLQVGAALISFSSIVVGS